MMRSSLITLAAVAFLSAPDLDSQTTTGEVMPAATPTQTNEGVLARYRPNAVAPVSLADSQRLDSLVRGGNIYLSLRDAIALAIENNLDVEYQRIAPAIAEADLLRARAGGVARGVASDVREGPSGLGSGGVGGAGSSAAGQRQGISGGAQGSGTGATGASGVQTSSAQISGSGPGVPSFDPALVGSLGWSKSNRPQTTTFLSGTNALVNRSVLWDFGIQKGFGFGGVAFLGADATRTNSNSLRADVNPSTNAGLALRLNQPLLQGFGLALNNRFIRIARNNRQVSDLVFQEQVISAAYAVERLYWDLVSLNGEVSVQRQTLTLSERLLNENIQQAEAGTLAPIEVTRARAEVARARRDLTVAETRVRQQETVIKDYLTRGTVDTVRLASLRIIATDTIAPPAQEQIQPLQELVATARKR
ncbi:MAG TPA: TolC family protein [Bryobacteraceae bacterium]|nr:TolC family protein [Bryobacteraceae bacterium]